MNPDTGRHFAPVVGVRRFLGHPQIGEAAGLWRQRPVAKRHAVDGPERQGAAIAPERERDPEHRPSALPALALARQQRARCRRRNQRRRSHVPAADHDPEYSIAPETFCVMLAEMLAGPSIVHVG